MANLVTKKNILGLLFLLVLGGVTLFVKDNSRFKRKAKIDLSKEGQLYRQVYGVFQNRCFNCHGEFMDYSETRWVRIGQVNPGSAADSILYRYLRGSGVGGVESMPPKHALPPHELKLIRRWIASVVYLPPKAKEFRLPAALPKMTPPERMLSEESIYHRCHSHLVREQVDKNDPLLQKIRSGELEGSSACSELLATAAFGVDGKLVGGRDRTRASKILRTLHNFHNSWFRNIDLFNINFSYPSFDNNDLSEPALHVTRAMFAANGEFQKVLKGKESLKAFREHDKKNEYFAYTKEHKYKHIADTKFYQGLDKAKSKENLEWVPSWVERGRLVGIGVQPERKEDILSMYTSKFVEPELFKRELNIRGNPGGGILGSQPYLLFNSGRELGEKMDGGLLMPRRWSKAVFRDLLCREIPVIAEEDSLKYLQPRSSIVFRKTPSCMQCHASIDNMAGAVRNISPVFSSNNPENYTQHIEIFARDHKVVEADIMVDKHKDYHLTPARGRLYFRNIYHQLVNEKVNSLEELGESIAKQDDFYVCAAKRYFEFFTGIDIHVEDYGANLGSYDAESIEYIRFLLFLGKRLKKHQKLRLLARDIFQSDYYRMRDYRIY